MSAVRQSCPFCRTPLSTAPEFPCQDVTCPGCGRRVSLPDTDSLPPEAAQPGAPEVETVAPPAPAAEIPATGTMLTGPWQQMAGSLTPLPGVPGYEVLCELGRGGMGVVYKARHLQLKRIVALKMILAGGHADAAEVARFKTEAEAIARLQHPNIVQIFEVGEHEGRPFFAMEFCSGGSLDKKLVGMPLPPREAAAIVETLARAMQAAHAANIVHRDLKPANVLLAADGTLKVTDFGLAKVLDGEGVTRTGAVIGTPSYMAPEQAVAAKQVGPPSDIYALGAILYKLLTSRPPFKAATTMDTLLQVMADEPVPPRQLQPSIPRDLETICLKCLEKEPRKRYSSSLDLAEDLHRYLSGEPVQARSAGTLSLVARWVRRRPIMAVTAALLCVYGLSQWNEVSIAVTLAVLSFFIWPRVATLLLAGAVWCAIALTSPVLRPAVGESPQVLEAWKAQAALNRWQGAVNGLIAGVMIGAMGWNITWLLRKDRAGAVLGALCGAAIFFIVMDFARLPMSPLSPPSLIYLQMVLWNVLGHLLGVSVAYSLSVLLGAIAGARYGPGRPQQPAPKGAGQALQPAWWESASRLWPVPAGAGSGALIFALVANLSLYTQFVHHHYRPLIFVFNPAGPSSPETMLLGLSPSDEQKMRASFAAPGLFFWERNQVHFLLAIVSALLGAMFATLSWRDLPLKVWREATDLGRSLRWAPTRIRRWLPYLSKWILSVILAFVILGTLTGALRAWIGHGFFGTMCLFAFF